MATIEMDSSVDADAAASASVEQIETQEWLDSLDFVLQSAGPERVTELLKLLEIHAQRQGVKIPFAATTPYINTIDCEAQPAYPGDREIERRIKSIIRWNAMAMVVRAQKTFRLTPPRRRCSKSVSTTFFALRKAQAPATSSFFRATAHPARMPAPSSKVV